MLSPVRAPVRAALKGLWLASPFARPPLHTELEKAVWYARFSDWCERNACPVSDTRSAFYHDVWSAEALSAGPISYLEFGCFEGESMRRSLALNTDPASTFTGFDSFRGLPEAWRGYDAGHFATAGRVPDIRDARCRFVAGMFQQTLPGFLAGYRPHERQVLLLDADLFSSTLYVLLAMGPRLQPGDVLLFDEFQSWMDEFRAFSCFLSAFPIEYAVIGRTSQWEQVAIKVLSNPYMMVPDSRS